MDLKEKLINIGCIDNKYLDDYISLIKENKKRIKEKYKTNCHHIIPRCYFRKNNLPEDNSKDNLVNLLWIDHVRAHYYLYKCLEGDLKKANAVSMRYVETKYKLNIDTILENSTEYQKIKEEASLYNSQIRKGKKHPHTPGWNKKISESNKGKKLSEEHKLKLSKINKGKRLTGKALYNVQHEDRTNSIKAKRTPEAREKARLKALGNINKRGWKAPEETKLLQSKNNGRNIKISCLETGEIWYNLNDCFRNTYIRAHYVRQLSDSNQPCKARIYKAYSEQIKIKIKKYLGKHFKILED